MHTYRVSSGKISLGGKLWASEASMEIFAITTPTLANTPTFDIHKLLEVVRSMP